MPEEDLVELKFRLYDGSDIGPIRYSSASTVATLKERIVADWPKALLKIERELEDREATNDGMSYCHVNTEKKQMAVTSVTIVESAC
ncbi:hypothetical protein GIB67_041823 [Kingdonia uniflora]|uniref:UBL3-like ubiquitin domain-containing protein n=1 Tax=Kingdonia uniflora TaxID=39325 RepID=A0A7J7L5U9_9MAGN|nr:hypothetical protein GIB67_041823 [Kingdonia uniflora]